jgi:hypothetical protein
MAASQVVLYFDKQEDAVLFTVAASSVISAEGQARGNEALARIAEEICKATRITTAGVLNPTGLPEENKLGQPQEQCA